LKFICQRKLDKTFGPNRIKTYDKNNEDEKTTAMALLLKEPKKEKKESSQR